MGQVESGEQILNAMARGRPWWKLRACDIAPWVRSLPAAVRDKTDSRLACVGAAWDGTSDISVGEPLRTAWPMSRFNLS